MSSVISLARPEIVAMERYYSARSLYKSQAGVSFLDANECPYEPFIGADKFSRYPDQQPPKMVEALCRLYDVSSRNLMITRGADEGMDLVLRTFCVPAEDNIIFCPPGFVMYAHYAKLQNAGIKSVPLTEDFLLDVSAIKKSADKNTKVVFVCSPNNPTANLMDKKDIFELCEYFDGKSIVVVDEAYIEFAGEEYSMISDLEKYSNLVILRTLSKSYAAAGTRCGITIASQEIIDVLSKVLATYPIPQPVVQAVMQIMNPKNLERLAGLREELLARKDKYIPIIAELDDVEKIYPSVVNFFMARVKDAGSFCARCKDAGIIIRDQSSQPGLENCVRVSVGSENDMERMIAALKGEEISVVSSMRTAEVVRKTSETVISVKVNLDQRGPVKIDTGIPFFDHMLEQVARHGGFSIVLECEGDLELDGHHTAEDCAIALGAAIRQALGDKRGTGRYGCYEVTLPMDEALANVALDLGGRFFLDFNAEFPDGFVGTAENNLSSDMIEHVFRSLAENLQANMHISAKGKNSHHIAEACFKGFGRCMRQAIRHESGSDELMSTKGVL